MKKLADYVEEIVEMLGKFEFRCYWETRDNTVRQCIDGPDVVAKLPKTETRFHFWIRRKPVFRQKPDGTWKRDYSRGASDEGYPHGEGWKERGMEAKDGS